MGRPSLGFREVQRRKKLHAVLRDARTVLEVAGPDADAQRHAVADLVAHAVVEVAILDRVTDSATAAGVYQNLIAVALDWDDAPWEAISRWNRLAPAPIAAFATAWADHLVRAERNSESKHHHRRLVDLSEISAGLGLTRQKTREIFGNAKCSLPPVKVRAGRVSPEDRAYLRGVADELGMSRERVVDIFRVSGRAGVEALIQKRSGVDPKWMSAFGIASPKRGRPATAGGFTTAVRETAAQFRVSERSIFQKIKAIRAEGPVEPEEYASEDMICLGRVAEELKSKRRRSVYSKDDTKIVVEWFTATTGRPPSAGQIRNWKYRKQWFSKVSIAKAWAAAQQISEHGLAKPAIVADANLTFEEPNVVPPARPVRPGKICASGEISEAPEVMAGADGF